MSSASNPGGAAPRPHEPSPDDERAQQPVDPGMLDEVLDQTLKSAAAGLSAGFSAESGDMEAFRAVARVHPGEPFTLEPICVELVRTALGRHFDPDILGPALLAVMTKKIAETLFDDPVAHGRLESLWRHLSEQ
jgi:hypothetical protein